MAASFLYGGLLLFQLYFKDGAYILSLTELLLNPLHFDMIVIKFFELLLDLTILGLDILTCICPQPLIQAPQLI